MQIRDATVNDIPQIQEVRHSVKENRLSDPSLVTDDDCREFLTRRGKGWVSEVNGVLTGFAIADLQDHNIWALFLRPEFENMGLGKRLHDRMLDWYFSQTTKTVWLSTTPRSRAEGFYRKMGWTEVGLYGKGEIKFRMTYECWTRLNARQRKT